MALICSLLDFNSSYGYCLFSFLDEPIVNLTGNCSGEVTINNINVCQSNDKPWNIMYSDLVCKERNCSHAISFNNKTTNGDMQEYQHVRCEDYHGKLGQCNRFKGKCNGGLVTVNCVSKYLCMYVCTLCITVHTPPVTLSKEMPLLLSLL